LCTLHLPLFSTLFQAPTLEQSSDRARWPEGLATPRTLSAACQVCVASGCNISLRSTDLWVVFLNLSDCRPPRRQADRSRRLRAVHGSSSLRSPEAVTHVLISLRTDHSICCRCAVVDRQSLGRGLGTSLVQLQWARFLQTGEQDATNIVSMANYYHEARAQVRNMKKAEEANRRRAERRAELHQTRVRTAPPHLLRGLRGACSVPQYM
jgi:hypothetical protein